MDIHKPKPFHNLREFLAEITVVVIGIAIALLGEQAIEAIHWSHKTEWAEAQLRYQLSQDADFAEEFVLMDGCAQSLIDRLEAAIIAKDPTAAKAILSVDAPFETHPWQVSAWEAVLANQVSDRLNPDRASRYGLVFRKVLAERELQWKLTDDFAVMSTARFNLGDDAKAENDRLAAVEKFRASMSNAVIISRSILHDSESLGVQPDAETVGQFKVKADACVVSTSAPLR